MLFRSLLSGTMGYTAAASAVQDNSAVVLSAGYDVANGVVASDPNATAGQTADISISRAYFPSTVTSHATGNLSLSGTGGTLFDKQASFQADKTINMSAGLGSSITSLSDLTLKAGRDEQGGAINVSVFGAGPLAVAAPGFINIAGTLMLDASATGDPASSAGLGAIGLDAAAGTINVLAAGGGLSANRLQIRAYAEGGSGTDRSGNATGGTVNLSAGSGGMGFAITDIDVSAYVSTDFGLPTNGGNATAEIGRAHV